ncbi:MAG TPA: BatA domain-containing protein, partial [Candidatus Sulfotelmatobacter sp.]|nr:BatA domain-containing protein [Candidatus Sulfotelmatobacter sp.]
MLTLGSLAFTAPWLLLGLAVLPVIWLVLRVTPPAPRLQRFPAIRLLFGLHQREETPARTPWWLILLRLALAALVILGLAHPLL